MSKQKFLTLDEAIEAGLEYMQEHFDLIKAQMQDPEFMDKTEDSHCAAWSEILKVRDQILIAKKALSIPTKEG